MVSRPDRKAISTGQREAAVIEMTCIEYRPGLTMPEFLKDCRAEIRCEQPG